MRDVRPSEVLLVTAGQPRRQSPFSAKGGAPPEPSACWDDREPADVAKAAPKVCLEWSRLVAAVLPNCPRMSVLQRVA